MPHKATEIANWFLDKASHEGKKLTQMQLVKLVYLSHGWFLGVADKPLIEENVQAWEWGPVIPEIYKEFKSWGSDPIDDFKKSFPNLNSEEQLTLDFVWRRYGSKSGFYLSKITHKPETPWDKTRTDTLNARHAVIPNREIAAHYKEIIKKAEEA